MNILGISCYYHDAAAAVIRDGTLVAAAEEERFSRRKHDYRFPVNAIDFCLAAAGVNRQQLDYVIFFEKPFLKFERLLLSCMQTFPQSHAVFREAMIAWLGDKLWVKKHLCEHFRLPAPRILFGEHHLSHAASAFYCSPFDEAAVVTVDGVGEWATATIGRGNASGVRILREVHFPHSMGLLYSAFTAFLGFEVNEGEYKVMGMAPFGTPRYVDKVWKVVRLHEDGSFELDMDFFSFHYSTGRTFSARFVELFGPPRDPSRPFYTRTTDYPAYYGDKPSDFLRVATENERYADIAASIQRVTEDILVALVREARKTTGLTRLCLAGGVALNSVANARVLRECGFEEIYIQPAAGDGGGAVGAALYGYHQVLGYPRRFVMDHAYWGQEYSAPEIEACLSRAGVAYRHIGDDRSLLQTAVDRLRDGKVVGWFQGRFEWGPRALGNRSILADPRRKDMKDTVNLKIKFREPFRPFAPSVLVEQAEKYFALADIKARHPARFMLYVVDVRQERRGQIPATTHVDGTARLQAVHRDTDARYCDLVDAFARDTGIPVVLNTSFNLKGEPIVNTPSDALSTFERSGIDTLVLGNFVVDKTA